MVTTAALVSLQHFLRDGAAPVTAQACPRLTDWRNRSHRSKNPGSEKLRCSPLARLTKQGSNIGIVRWTIHRTLDEGATQ